jgi:hypothetical protein
MGDKCSAGVTVQMGGKSIGDLLNEKGISWAPSWVGSI